ncbi:diphthine--ammonia ligase [Candidatus Woesearchaeota archaeon]|nr:MAG: diphthine--ammonia ligase [Candidatus Woesearchaeota archaeon]
MIAKKNTKKRARHAPTPFLNPCDFLIFLQTQKKTMCGIIGAFNHEDATTIITAGLELIKHRGRDGCGLYDGTTLQHAHTPNDITPSPSPNQVAHVLHSIVGHASQPLLSENACLVANCEIYNWKTLCKEEHITAKNDAHLLLALLDKYGIEQTLTRIRGVYAFCYWKQDEAWLARDIIGIKPLWYANTPQGFCFASEKKALPPGARELCPRTLLRYRLATKTLDETTRPFFTIQEREHDLNAAAKTLSTLIETAVRIRIPEKKTGILFSGGLDSSLIAFLLKRSGVNCACYTVTTSQRSPVVARAKKAACLLGLDLNLITINKEDIARNLPAILGLIEDSNPVKASVAITTFFASKKAARDGNKVIFSGAGADELFAGYTRIKKERNTINKDCYSELLKTYEKNTYRDDVITMHHCLELRTPYLDTDIATYAFNLHPSLKADTTGEDKIVLRRAAHLLGLPAELCSTPKKATQYDSGTTKALTTLAKEARTTQAGFLQRIRPAPNPRLAILLSGGKDSLYAAFIMQRMNYPLTCAVILESANKDSFMFHTPNISLAKLQAESMNLPVVLQPTSGTKEEELNDLHAALKRARDQHSVEGIVTGAIASNYQRDRIEAVADRLGLKTFSPLWHTNQEQELRDLLNAGFTIILSSIAADGLDKTWLGRELTTADVDALAKLHAKNRINIAGEGGEFESLVTDCPLFTKTLRIEQARTEMENEHTGRLIITRAVLKPKNPSSEHLPLRHADTH